MSNMDTTNNINTTPGGTLATDNPPFSTGKVGFADSGGSHILLNQAFHRSGLTPRSPIKSMQFSFDQGTLEKTIRSSSETLPGTSTSIINNDFLLQRFEQMEKTIAKLNNEVAELRRENRTLKDAKINDEAETALLNKNPFQPLTDQYCTDEEELERETNWILERRKRKNKKVRKDTTVTKRKAESSPEVESKEADIALSSKQIPPKVLAKEKKTLPPPINIIGVKEYNDIQRLMKLVVSKDYKVVSLNNNIWKINTTEPEDYKALANKLNTDGHEWYTYEDKNDRPIKVMARGLHQSCLKEDIMEELTSEGFKIIDAVNIIKKEKKQNKEGKTEIIRRGLPLFMLTFDNKEKIEKIYNIKSILHLRVKIEPLRKTTGLIPQCKKCQEFNHTQKYCNREPKCVKCAGNHAANDCKINKNTPPKCINCRGQHPANYRGCEVAIELQKMRNKSRKLKQNHVKHGQETEKELIATNNSVRARSERVIPNLAYSHVAQQKDQRQEKVDQTLQDILRNLEALNKRLDAQEASLQNTLVEVKKQAVWVETNLEKVYQNISYIKLNYKIKK